MPAFSFSQTGCVCLVCARWGDQSAKLGALPAPEALRQHTSSEGRKKKAVEAWGAELKSAEDVKAVFAAYYSGEVALLPW